MGDLLGRTVWQLKEMGTEEILNCFKICVCNRQLMASKGSRGWPIADIENSINTNARNFSLKLIF
jgi:hypothetical protein